MRSQLERFASRRRKHILDSEARSFEQSPDFCGGVDPLLAVSRFDFAVSNKDIFSLETTLRRIVVVSDRKQNVGDLIPFAFAIVGDDRLSQRAGVDYEPASGFQRSRHSV